jgi:hypothetical protein
MTVWINDSVKHADATIDQMTVTQFTVVLHHNSLNRCNPEFSDATTPPGSALF